MHTRIGIPTAELQERRERLLEHAGGLGLGGVVLFDADYIRYFTNFNFLATERPVAVAVSATGDLTAFVPEFEVERVQEETEFEHVASYPEYPGEEHPLRILGPRAGRRRHRRASSGPTATAIRASSATRGRR